MNLKILIEKIVYHSGTSFKELGKKCFGIHGIENKVEIDILVNELIKNSSIDNQYYLR